MNFGKKKYVRVQSWKAAQCAFANFGNSSEVKTWLRLARPTYTSPNPPHLPHACNSPKPPSSPLHTLELSFYTQNCAFQHIRTPSPWSRGSALGWYSMGRTFKSESESPKVIRLPLISLTRNDLVAKSVLKK